MTDDELIAKQARLIAELTEAVAAYGEAERNIHAIIYGIGGPLNDNKLGYSKEQMLTFLRIAEQLTE